MADSAPLSPDELDRIEDALEWLEAAPALGEESPRVRARLAEYREILAATRDALPLEDVPAGLLDGVIAQARASAGAEVVAPSTRDARPSAWERFRRTFLVPTLALAGTAALVLVIVRPDPPASGIDGGAVATNDAVTQRETAERSDADRHDGAAPGEAREIAGEAAVTEESSTPSPAAAAPIEAPKAEAPGSLSRLDAAERKREETSGLDDLVEQRAKNGPVPAEVPGWDLVEKADSARKAGDCRSAREAYAVAAEDDDPAVRARAFAGLGLCDAAAGNTDAAEENFARARGEDGSIDALIDRETAKPYRPSSRAAKPAAKKKLRSKASPSADDPLTGL